MPPEKSPQGVIMDFAKYADQKIAPLAADFYIKHWYYHGQVIAKRIGTADIEYLVPGYSSHQLSACAVEQYLDNDAYAAAQNEVDAYNENLALEFKADVFAVLGITGHAMAENLFSIAKANSTTPQQMFNLLKTLWQVFSNLPHECVE